LIVEDSKTQRFLLRCHLRSSDHELLEAADAEQAQALISTTLPDAILLDWELPGTNGLAFLKSLKEDPRTVRIPVLMVTSHRDSKRISQALDLGAVDFVPKPPDRVELQARLKSALKLKEYEDQLIAANQERLRRTDSALQSVNFEYKRKDAELSRLSSDMKHLLHSACIGMIFLDAELCVRTFTDSATSVFSLLPSDIGRPIDQVVCLSDHKATVEDVRHVARTGEPVDREVGLKDGRLALMQVRPYLEFPSTECRGVVISFVDIRALRRSDERIWLDAAMLDHLASGVAVWRLEDRGDPRSFRFVHCNAAASKHAGTDLSLLVGLTAGEVFGPAVESGVFEQYRQVVLTGESFTEEMELSDDRIERRTFRHTVSRGPNETALVVFEDISEEERRRSAAQLAHRMEAIGEVAGGIAHDLNNLLGVILMGAAIARESVDGGDCAECVEELDVISEASDRAADLVSQLLAYSKRRPVSPSVFSPTSLISRLTPVLARVLGAGIDLQTRLPSDVWSVEMDPGALEQVLVNLAANARHAMPNGGRLDLIVANTSNTWVEIRCEDSGPGMDETTLSRCFDPYFTTRPKGIGTGLGLATCGGLIGQAGGAMTAESVQGEGATFIIRLPRSVREPETEKVAVSLPRGGTETIFLVEDEESLRNLVEKELNTAGYTVKSAENGEMVLDMVRTHGVPDLLFTDVIMPGMNGAALAERVRALAPGTPVLFMSGYADHAAVRGTAWQYGEHHFLEKPFIRKTLLHAVRNALDTPPV